MHIRARHLRRDTFYYVVTNRHERPIPCGPGEDGEARARERLAEMENDARRAAAGLGPEPWPGVVRPDRDRRGVIYFIGSGPSGPVKIGYTREHGAKARLAAIQTGYPMQLEVLATIPGNREEERAMHERFRRSRLCGEWFLRTPSLEAMIRSLCRA
ncbi:MAG: GIY-YIG nuclease family protein [Acidobacteriota bacterium]|nr:GIY-YIG nuclease family protein [Acidobacteriota bacterium]MDQ6892263.1 GIY-YIG nuclease family protein [Acidobacteriota bacterium]